MVFLVECEDCGVGYTFMVLVRLVFVGAKGKDLRLSGTQVIFFSPGPRVKSSYLDDC